MMFEDRKSYNEATAIHIKNVLQVKHSWKSKCTGANPQNPEARQRNGANERGKDKLVPTRSAKFLCFGSLDPVPLLANSATAH
jgi:hypothetical protein